MSRAVAGLTALGKQGYLVFFIFMGIVAVQAGNLAQGKAFTGGQQAHLVTVHINIVDIRIRWRKGEVVAQRIPGLEGKRRFCLVQLTSVAE